MDHGQSLIETAHYFCVIWPEFVTLMELQKKNKGKYTTINYFDTYVVLPRYNVDFFR